MSDQTLVNAQTVQLAELDKQMAVWNQRLTTLDQQITTVSQTLQDSVQSLQTNLTNLVASADAWLAQNTTNPLLVAKVTALRESITQLGTLDFTDPQVMSKITILSSELQTLSTDLVMDLSAQAASFAESLDKASADLVTHYGIQI